MIALIEDNRDAIADVCRQYGVQRLAVFGSAVKGTFDPATSDLDFAVEFADCGPGIGKRFMQFIVALEDLFPDHPIHISTLHAGLSETFQNELQATAVTIMNTDVRQNLGVALTFPLLSRETGHRNQAGKISVRGFGNRWRQHEPPAGYRPTLSRHGLRRSGEFRLHRLENGTSFAVTSATSVNQDRDLHVEYRQSI